VADRLALVGERAGKRCGPFVVAAFLILSLFDLWSVMPPLLHRGLLIAGIALLVSLAADPLPHADPRRGAAAA
jgi:hypothetical protein